MSLRLVWIEWGRRIPKYLKRNIDLHFELFPNLNQILITDKPEKVNRTFSNLVVVDSDVIPKSDVSREFELISLKRQNIYKQSEFWIGTTRRFFQLYDYMCEFDVETALHMESDNILLDETLVEKLSNSEVRSLFFPMQSNTLGCGSIFLVRDRNSLRTFLDFILARWEDGTQNDMRLLGEYAMSARGYVNLPSTPEKDFCFDPGAYGKYFLGSDARNFRIPTSRRGIKSEESSSLLNMMEKYTFDVKMFESDIEILVDGKSTLVNLHVHSKYIPRSIPELQKQICKGFINHRGYFWKMGKFDLLVIGERVLSKLARIFGLNQEFRLR